MSIPQREYKSSFPAHWIVSSKPGTPFPYYVKLDDRSSNVPTAPPLLFAEPIETCQDVHSENRQQKDTLPSIPGITKYSQPLNAEQDISAASRPLQPQLLAASTTGPELRSYSSSLRDSNPTSLAKRNKLKTFLSFTKPTSAEPFDKATPKSSTSTKSFWGSSPRRFGFRKKDKTWSSTEALQKNSSESTASQEDGHALGAVGRFSHSQNSDNQHDSAAANLGTAAGGLPTNHNASFEPPQALSPIQSPSHTISTSGQSDAPARFPYTGSLYTPVTPGTAAYSAQRGQAVEDADGFSRA